jgi:dynamin 1-like protein
VTVTKEDDAATDSADEFPSGAAAPSGVATKTRSVSATLQHERERPRGAGAKASPRSSNASDSRVSTHRSSHPNTLQQQQHNFHGSPHTTRDSFLTYFFGQNGPGPIGASSAVSAASVVSAAGSGSAYGVGSGGDGVPASGRDVSGGADIVLRSGLLVGKHDGNSAAYDMKSLGKHIEAVRSSIITYTHLSWMADDDYDLPSYRSQRTEHN